MDVKTLKEQIVNQKELKTKIMNLSGEYYQNLKENGMPLEESNNYVETFNKLQETYDNNDKIIREAVENLNEEDKIIIKNYNDEIIEEALNIYSKQKVGKRPAIMVRIDDEDERGMGYLQDPYLGIYDGTSFGNSKNMVRVGILTGKLLNHKNTGRKGKLGHLPANSDQLKEFLAIKGNFVNMIWNYLATKFEEYNRDKPDNEKMYPNYDLEDILNFNHYIDERTSEKTADVRKLR